MIVKLKSFSGETPEEETLSPKKKLSKEDKIALGAATAGLSIAGLGQGYASKKRRDFLKRTADWYQSHGMSKESAREAAKTEWNSGSRCSLRDRLKSTKFWRKDFKEAKSLKEDLGIETFYPLSNYQYGQSKDLLGEKVGKIIRNTGLGIAGAGLTYGGYKLYKHHKNKKKQQQENDH